MADDSDKKIPEEPVGQTSGQTLPAKTPDATTLRRGWTTGANAAAAALMALKGFHRGVQKIGTPRVAIDLPHHQGVVFTGEAVEEKNGRVLAHFKKDAGDDPDITHGIIVSAEIIPLTKTMIKNYNDKDEPTILLTGGKGVGRVTRLGLPLAVGAPAITKRPSDYIKKNFLQYLQQHGDLPRHWEIIFHLENGVALAKHTLNPRLGIVDGLSILGTSGVVIPFSCAAWIDSIHRSIDVALAYHQQHLLAATGSISEQTVKEKTQVDDMAVIDMGDFYIATMKYLRKKNYSGRLTIGGGPGKLLKLAQGHGDLHNGRSRADMGLLAQWCRAVADGRQQNGNDEKIILRDEEKNMMATAIEKSSSVAEALANLPPPLSALVCRVILHHCQRVARADFPNIMINFIMVDRSGNIMAENFCHPEREQ
ncbi:MAG: cobalt-precorrin-5B (C(1))-methyltransferase CbiD [Hydrotalea sp.]|nr:cobalt-precorrin-5B (C(1))-methyltransferase CbiD [Hydrotalea sp.]